MTALEARKTVFEKEGNSTAKKIYEYFQSEIQKSVLNSNFSCTVKISNYLFYIDHKGNKHQVPIFTELVKAINLLKAEGFYCHISPLVGEEYETGGENLVKVEW